MPSEEEQEGSRGAREIGARGRQRVRKRGEERRGEEVSGRSGAEWSGVGWSGPERDEGGGDDLKIALGILTDMPALEGAIGSNV